MAAGFVGGTSWRHQIRCEIVSSFKTIRPVLPRSEYLRAIFLQIMYASWKTNRSEENRSRNVGEVSKSERHDECKLESESWRPVSREIDDLSLEAPRSHTIGPRQPWIMNGPQVFSIVSRAGRTDVHSNDTTFRVRPTEEIIRCHGIR